MTEQEIRAEIEQKVFLYYTRGRLEDEAEYYGYKYNVETAKRSALERFVINNLVKERMNNYDRK